MTVERLLSHRLLFVTGKGGTGKTTLAAAVGRLAAERGKRVLVAEIDTHQPSLTSIFGVKPSYQPTMVAPNLAVCDIRWEEALEEWLERTVPGQRVVRLILHNRVVHVFLDATPGAREVVILSRLATLVEEWDLVVVDMPASGHAVGMLRVPNLAKRLMRGGPIRTRAEEVLALFARPDTALLMVTLPEEMVVNETVETWQAIRSEVPSLRIPLVGLNRAAVPSLTDDETALLHRLSARYPGDDERGELLLAGRWEAGLEASTADAIHRLGAEIPAEILPLPRLGSLGGFEGGPDRVVLQLVAALARRDIAERAP